MAPLVAGGGRRRHSHAKCIIDVNNIITVMRWAASLPVYGDNRNVGARLLAKAISERGCPSLESLNLSGTDLGNAGAKEIGR